MFSGISCEPANMTLAYNNLLSDMIINEYDIKLVEDYCCFNERRQRGLKRGLALFVRKEQDIRFHKPIFGR